MRALSLSMRWCLALALPGCIDPYMPDVINTTKSYLVVDGFINSQGSTSINLSRTFDIAAKTVPPIETRATLFIEEEGGTRYPVPESSVRGTYTSATLMLNPTKNYRLLIRTAAGLEYASAFVPAKITPPIDAVTWRTSDNGITIYVDTHDDTRSTQYYRWEYEETWQIRSPYSPTVEYKNGRIQDLLTPYPTFCWSTAKSSDIRISNTTRLSRDEVSDFPLRALSTTANKLYIGYSILVKQRAQTAVENMYWEQLQKNTEKIGTLFDPLPSQLTGNVQCLNDDTELALGYIGAHTVAEKRLFINRAELPNDWRVRSGYEACIPPDTIGISPQLMQVTFGNPNYLPINPIYSRNSIVVGYLGQSRDCIDCRTRGTAVKPSFWP